jgi:hypothetical protein
LIIVGFSFFLLVRNECFGFDVISHIYQLWSYMTTIPSVSRTVNVIIMPSN